MKRIWVGSVLSSGMLAIGLLSIAGSPAGASVKPHAAKTLYVAPKTGRSKLPGGCKTAAYSQINAAIKKAAPGDTIVVCAGTYTGSATLKVSPPGGGTVTVTSGALIEKAIHLVGETGAIINAKGLVNAVTIFGPGAVGASVKGFTAENAIGEGILAAATGGILIANNTVEHNDNGGPKSNWPFCQASGNVPNDCGEGIHLLSVTHSKIVNNTSEFNSGGILLSDEFGPNDGNTVNGNLVEDNESDCGITVVGHGNTAVNSKGVPTPLKGGVYDNTISANVVISNGTTGDGGGVLIASGVSGGGSYDNTVTGNEIAGNGLSGVTIHQHFPLSDVSGNVVSGNWIGTNDLLGDPGTGDSVTTGVLVDNGGTHKTINVKITGNTIAWDVYGIYDDAPGLVQHTNTFLHVTVNVKH
jgi:hypothetical protein